MFDPSFDPLQQLVDLQQNMLQLKINQEKIIHAANHQAKALTLLNEQVSQLNASIICQEQLVNYLCSVVNDIK